MLAIIGQMISVLVTLKEITCARSVGMSIDTEYCLLWRIYRPAWLFLKLIDTHETIVNATRILSWWRHQTETFPRYWPFVRGIHRSPVNFLQKGQWRGALMFSLICALNKRLSKQWWGWWFETPSCPLWRHCSIWRFTSACWFRIYSIWNRSCRWLSTQRL